MSMKVCLRCKGKILLRAVNKNFWRKSLLRSLSNVLTYFLKWTFPPIIWTELKRKTMGSNPGYHFKSCLLYQQFQFYYSHNCTKLTTGFWGRTALRPPSKWNIRVFFLHFPKELSIHYVWRKWENSFRKVGKKFAQLAVSVYRD